MSFILPDGASESLFGSIVASAVPHVPCGIRLGMVSIKYAFAKIGRRLQCSEITACVLYGLIPVFCSFVSQFWSGSYFKFHLPVSRLRRKLCFIPNVTAFSAQTGQAVQFLRRVIPMMKSGSHVLYLKDNEGVFILRNIKTKSMNGNGKWKWLYIYIYVCVCVCVCLRHRNWRTPSSMEFRVTARDSEIGALQVPWIFWVLHLDRIPWNLSFQILIKSIFNFAEWINFRQL